MYKHCRNFSYQYKRNYDLSQFRASPWRYTYIQGRLALDLLATFNFLWDLPRSSGLQSPKNRPISHWKRLGRAALIMP
jgi:hypothetical protein